MLQLHEYDEFIKTIEKTDENFDIDVKDNQENYLLTYAVMLNRPDVFEVLVKKNARLDIFDKDGKSLIYTAIKMNYIKIIDLILKYNETNIGVTITKLYDSKKLIPLHYAIDFKHEYAIKKLLEHSSDVNYCEGQGYNSLHIAIFTRSVNICNLILPYITNINAITKFGETALHIACNIRQPTLVKLLIDNKCDVNKQTEWEGKTAITIATENNDYETFMLLYNMNANMDLQDYIGCNPLFYSIQSDNYKFFEMIIKKSVNVNLWDFDYLNIPLMSVFDKKLNTKYIDGLIEKTDFLFQNDDGNTCLHYIVGLDLWKQYKNFLVKKRLDILLKNKNNQSAYDLIKNSDKQEFIDMVIESYMNRLKKTKEGWFLEWENKCFENINECKNNIRDKINELINEYEKQKNQKNQKNKKKIKEITDSCKRKTYPVMKNKVCIDLYENKLVTYCTYSGVILDILMGLLYLLQKHSTIADGIIKKVYESHENACKFFRSHQYIINSKCELIQFELIWANQQIWYVNSFIDSIINCKKRFVIIPMGIMTKDGNHSNYLIYDNKLKEIERFEPHGLSASFDYMYNPSLLNTILEQKFKSYNITYISPDNFLPKIGFQYFDVREHKSSKVGDIQGFCGVWSTWYTDMRLTYADIPRKKLVKKLIYKIQEKQMSFRNMIRDYSANITNLRDNLLKKSKIDINDWINEKYTDKQLDSLIDNIENIIHK